MNLSKDYFEKLQGCHINKDKKCYFTACAVVNKATL
jgi:hypothetical protein